MTLVERPYHNCYSKNEIRYVFTTPDETVAGLFLQVKILYAPVNSLVFTELYTFEELKYNADKTVYLPIQAYIDSVVKHVLPIYNAAMTDAEEQCIKFFIHYREVTDATPDPLWDESENANVCIAIKGGIENMKTSRNNIFINYFDVAKPFLTWQPSHRFIFYDELVYVSFINPAKAAFKVFGNIVATDGTVIPFWTYHAGANKYLYHLNISPSLLNLKGYTSKDIYYYEIWITDALDNVLVNAYRLYIEYRSSYEYYDLFYHNSIGGVDTVRITGDVDPSIDRTTTEAEGGIAVNDWNAKTKAHQKSFSNIFLQRNFKGNIGLLKTRTKEQQESFLDLLASKSVYMLIDGRWIPVNNIQRSVSLGNRKVTTAGFPVEWQLSETNEVFTPWNKKFGDGI